MKNKLISFLKVFLPLGLGVLLLWLLMRQYDINDIWQRVSKADFKWVIICVCFGFISNISRAIRWNMLLNTLGYRPRLINTFMSVLVGYFYNLVFPRAGEVSRCSMLATYEKVPLDKSLGTVIAERIIDMITLLVCLVLVLVFEFERLSAFVKEYIFHPVVSKFSFLQQGFIVYYLIVAVIIFGLLIYVGRRYLKDNIIYTRLTKIIKGFVQGLESVRKVKSLGWFIFHSILIWVLYILGTYMCFLAFGFTSHLSLFTALVITTFGAFGYVAPVQGGAGAYHGIVKAVLLLYGVADENGIAFGWLAWGTQTIGIILLGILSLLLFPVINRTQLSGNDTPATGTK